MLATNKNMEEKKGKNNQMKTIVGLVVGVLAYLLVKLVFFAPVSFDKQLMKIASELNESCPIMVDSETRLDNTVALPNHVFQYHYTLMNNTADEIDPEVFEKDLESRLINSIKESPDMKTFRDNDVTMNYSYSDKNGRFIAKISITPDEYK